MAKEMGQEIDIELFEEPKIRDGVVSACLSITTTNDKYYEYDLMSEEVAEVELADYVDFNEAMEAAVEEVLDIAHDSVSSMYDDMKEAVFNKCCEWDNTYPYAK